MEASEAGMRQSGLPFSGQYGFIETEMYWPINHMVSPKEKSVSCAECHTRKDGRLANLTGFYVPGRDYNKSLDFYGFWAFVLTIAGVFSHAFIRASYNIIKNKFEKQIIDYDDKQLDE
jgi:hypothetical protein